MDPFFFLCNDHPVYITPKLSLRAKRLSLRVSSEPNTFILTLPLRTSSVNIDTFLTQCGPWMEKNRKTHSVCIQVTPGGNVKLHGDTFHCLVDPLRRKPVVCLRTGTFLLPSKCSQKALEACLKEVAIKMLTPYAWEATQALGQSVRKISFRDTKSRWGSCSSQKNISLNWRLVLAPPEVAQYVCIHEAVHLLHMNHTEVFWKKVEDLCPAYKIHRQWLKRQGKSLMNIILVMPSSF